MLPEDQKQPQIARVMKIVPEQAAASSSNSAHAAQPEPAPAAQAVNEDFGYEDEDAELDESEEDDGWEMPKKFVGSNNSNGGSFAAVANSRGESGCSRREGCAVRLIWSLRPISPLGSFAQQVLLVDQL